MFRMRGCFDLQADDGLGTAAAHRTALFIAVVTSLNDINAMDIHVNAMRIMGYTASASITPRNRLLGDGMALLAMDHLGQ